MGLTGGKIFLSYDLCFICDGEASHLKNVKDRCSGKGLEESGHRFEITTLGNERKIYSG